MKEHTGSLTPGDVEHNDRNTYTTTTGTMISNDVYNVDRKTYTHTAGNSTSDGVNSMDRNTYTNTAGTLTSDGVNDMDRNTYTNTAGTLTSDDVNNMDRITYTNTAGTMTSDDVNSMDRNTYTNTAGTLTSDGVNSMDRNTYTNTAGTMTSDGVNSMDRNTYTNTAGTMTSDGVNSMDRIPYTNTTGTLTSDGVNDMDRNTYTNTAGTLTSDDVSNMDRITHTNTAGTSTSDGVNSMDRNTYTNTVGTLTSDGVNDMDRNTYTNTAGTLTYDDVSNMDRITYTNTAGTSTSDGVNSMDRNTYTNTVGTLTSDGVNDMDRNTYTNTAGTLTSDGFNNMDRNTYTNTAGTLTSDGVNNMDHNTYTNTARTLTFDGVKHVDRNTYTNTARISTNGDVYNLDRNAYTNTTGTSPSDDVINVDHNTYTNTAFTDTDISLECVVRDTSDEGRRELEVLEPDDHVTIADEKPISFKLKFIITLFIFWDMFTLGMVYAQMGPTLPDLQLITGSSLQEATWLFTGFGIGYIAGCLLAGLALEFLNPRLMLFACTLVTGAVAGVLPWIQIIYVSIGIKVIQGITLAGQDTVGIAMLFAIWKKKTGPYHQLLHIVYAGGLLLSPLYTKPFLHDDQAVLQEETINNMTSNTSSNATTGELSKETNVHYAFLISALASVSAAVPFLLMYIFRVQDPTSFKQESKEENKSDALLGAQIKYSLIAFSFVMALIIHACVDMFPNLLTTFIIEQLHWNQQKAADITAVYYGLYGVGNLIGALVLKYSTTNKLIVASYTSSIVCLSVCVIGSLLRQNIVIWITIAVLGVGMACFMPTIYVWVEENVTHVTGRIASGLQLFGAIGLMLQPVLLGYLMDLSTPMWFLYITLGGLVVCAIFFIIAFLIVKKRKHE